MKQQVKQWLRPWPWAFTAVHGAYSRVYPWLARRDAARLRRAILAAVAGRSDVYFIQVGSNDGQSNDPIAELVRARAWRGILIEPAPSIFNRLRANYGDDPRLIFENVAISSDCGSATFFRIEADEATAATLPPWYDQIGGFSRSHIVAQLGPGIERLIREEPVRCVTLGHLCQTHNVQRIDLLHVDVEGAEHTVLCQIDFARLRPTAILYEHRHMPGPDADAAARLLRSHGYRLRRFGPDTFAC